MYIEFKSSGPPLFFLSFSLSSRIFTIYKACKFVLAIYVEQNGGNSLARHQARKASPRTRFASI